MRARMRTGGWRLTLLLAALVAASGCDPRAGEREPPDAGPADDAGGCTEGCLSDGDCRLGEICDGLTECGSCRPGCRNDTDCAAGGRCDLFTQECLYPDGGVPDGGGSGDGGTPTGGAPPWPVYSEGACPTLVGGAGADDSVNIGFLSSGDLRRFRLIVPSTYDGSREVPLVVGWHWLNASSRSFANDGEVGDAARDFDFIAVLLDRLEDASGTKAYQFDWPFVETWGAEKEMLFVEDVIACVRQQFRIDRNHVHAMGVSAGGLWLAYVSTQPLADRFATMNPISGGLGRDPLGFWDMEFTPQPHKFPSVITWGGVTDNLLAVDFHAASQRYRDALLGDGHFVVACMHDQGHDMPPFVPPAGATRFFVLWRFMRDHPWGLAAGTSPYQGAGLDANWPDWCTVP